MYWMPHSCGVLFPITGRRIYQLGGVSEALTSVSKTINLSGNPSDLYRGDNKYQLFLERELEGFQRKDPPSVPQLAVPVTVPHSAFTDGIISTDPFVRLIGCLILVDFYFLLRVGEYTKPRTVVKDGKRVCVTRTKQFVVLNVGFYHNGVVIPRTAPLATFLTVDHATLKISNQKNG